MESLPKKLIPLPDVTFTCKYDGSSEPDWNAIAATFPCTFCGKPSEVGATMAFGTALCSVECLQQQLDKRGGTVHFPDGTELRVAPGQVRLEMREEIR